MTSYPNPADKAAKQFDKLPKDTQKEAASISDKAQSFLKDARGNVDEMATEAKKHIKDDIQKATAFVKDNPTKGALYALGIGAALAFIFLPRRK